MLHLTIITYVRYLDPSGGALGVNIHRQAKFFWRSKPSLVENDFVLATEIYFLTLHPEATASLYLGWEWKQMASFFILGSIIKGTFDHITDRYAYRTQPFVNILLIFWKISISSTMIKFLENVPKGLGILGSDL